MSFNFFKINIIQLFKAFFISSLILFSGCKGDIRVELLNFIKTPDPIDVTISQKSSQADPTKNFPIEFEVEFSKEIKEESFIVSDVTQQGSASNVIWSITSQGDKKKFLLKAISASSSGTVKPIILNSKVTALSGGVNSLASGVDRQVLLDMTKPEVEISQHLSQTDPALVLPIDFTVYFSEKINPSTFTTMDISQVGTATGVSFSIINSGNDQLFTLRATGLSTAGSIIPQINADSVEDVVGNFNNDSSSTDGSVTYTPNNLYITVNQKFDQLDPINAVPINFSIEFDRAINPSSFTVGDITQNGSATGVVWSITNSGDDRNFILSATSITANGTVIPVISAGSVQDPSGSLSNASSSTDNTVTYDTLSPSVTIDQKLGQADPAINLPVEFSIVFSEAINPASFTNSDITQSGTASGITWAIVNSGDNRNFTLRATAISTVGTLIPTIAANTVQDGAGNNNYASTSTDNNVNFDNQAPTVSVDQKIGQLDPINTLPIEFTVVFSEAIIPGTFTTADITQSGTATGITWAIVNSGDDTTFTLRATASSEGTIRPIIGAASVTDLVGNNNTASTSTDNTVVYDTTAPTLTINQAGGQVDPINSTPINFAVVFSETINPSTFTTADIIQSGTATGITWTIINSGNDRDFTLRATAVSGDGTLIPSVALNTIKDVAGNDNAASTSTDNTVNYDSQKPNVTINQKVGQVDPANTLPVEFTVTFSEAINPTSFIASDITQSGSATGITWAIVNSGDDTIFTLRATVSSNGTLIPSIGANLVSDLAGNLNNSSTSTDNSVTYDNVAPVASTLLGVTGTGDASNDNLLSSGAGNDIVTVNWSDLSSDEINFKIKIFENDGTTEKCSEVTKVANSTTHTFSGCSLVQGKAYKISFVTTDSAGNTTNATNHLYSFLYAPDLTVADVAVSEDVSGSKMTFTPTLNVASDWNTTFNFATSDGTALIAGTFRDYDAASGSKTITAGQTTTTIDVTIVNDIYDEPDAQTYSLTLSTIGNAKLVDGVAVGTINDEDAPPTISVAAAVKKESATPISFTSTLSLISEKTISYSWSTTNGSAVNGVLFTGGSGGPITITAGTLSSIVNIPIIDNTTVCQGDRTFTYAINSLTNVTAGTMTSVAGTIQEDDFPGITVTNASVMEGQKIVFEAALTQACPTNDIAIKWKLGSGSALIGQDFLDQSGSIVIRKGETQNAMIVDTIDDSDRESEEDFTMTAYGDQGYESVIPGVGVGKIIDNDSGTIGVVKIAHGVSHNCALWSDGRVKCWGDNNFGKLGRSDFTYGDDAVDMGDNLPYVNLGTGRTVTQVSVGRHTTCALLDNQKVKCFGGSTTSGSGALGSGLGIVTVGMYAGEMGDKLPYSNFGSLIKEVQTAEAHTCALTVDNQLRCLGDPSFGKLGYEDNVSRGHTPATAGSTLKNVNLGTGKTVQSFSVGYLSTCAILNDGHLKCWGYNNYGQLGYGDTNNRGGSPGDMGDNLLNVNLGTNKRASKIYVGNAHTCAIIDDIDGDDSDDGKVKCWGLGSDGRLGYENISNYGNDPGEMGDALPFVNLGTGRTATKLSLGDSHTCAILDNNTAKCWGYNTSGQLGKAATTTIGDGAGEMGDALTAINFGTGLTPVDVVAGNLYTCFKLNNNSIKCFGNNSYGQLGIGSTVDIGDNAGEMGDALSAINFGTGLTVNKLATNASKGSHNCFITNENKLKCLGYNYFGQTGLESGSVGAKPSDMGAGLKVVNLGTGVRVKDIIAGGYSTCVITYDDRVKCWGQNTISGEFTLGQGRNGESYGGRVVDMGDNLPYTNLGTGRTVKKLVGGIESYCAILDNDLLKCWGGNSFGQLGLGDTSSRGASAATMGDNLPYVNLGTGRKVLDVVSGYGHVCAKLDNLKVKCWGSGFRGSNLSGTSNVIGDSASEMGDNLASLDLGSNLYPIQMYNDGTTHTCFVLNNGKLKCLGSNYACSLGQGICGENHLGDAANETGDITPFVNLGSNLTISKVVTGGKNQYGYAGSTCVLFTNGKVKCFGNMIYSSSSDNPLGYENGTNNIGSNINLLGDNLSFIDLGDNVFAKDIFSGHQVICAHTSTNQYKCWGRNSIGQLGVGDLAHRGSQPQTMGNKLPYIDFSEAASPLGAFAIKGVTGSGDTILDDKLAHTEATLNWSASTNATLYKASILASDKTTVVCAEVTTAATLYSFTGCTLTNGETYYAKVVAEDGVPNFMEASNSLMKFVVGTNSMPSFAILGVTGDLDSTLDANLTDGEFAKIHWQKNPDAVSYRVRIFENDGTTIKCAEEIVSGNSLSFNFNNCSLSDGASYKAQVVAYDVYGNTLNASNSLFNFSLSDANQPASFMILGVGGPNESLDDNVLDVDSWVTVKWERASGANFYEVTIFQNDGVTTACSMQTVTKEEITSSFQSCNLTTGNTYKAKVVAKDTFNTIEATNSLYTFTTSFNFGSYLITGITGSASDSTLDNVFNGAGNPIVNVTTASSSTFLKVNIWNSDRSIQICSNAEYTPVLSIEVKKCHLKAGETYYATVENQVLVNAYNSPYKFTIPNYPTISLNNPSTSEGSNLTFTASLSNVWPNDVTVSWAVTGIKAQAGQDFNRSLGSITIPAGQTTASINIATLNDSREEFDEDVIVSLYNPINATITKNSIGRGTIIDDDTTVSVLKTYAGTNTSCVHFSTGEVKCFGMRQFGSIGLVDFEIGDESGEMGDNLQTVSLPSGRYATKIATSLNAACVLLDNGSITCFGGSYNNQLGFTSSVNHGEFPNSMGDNLLTTNFGGTIAKLYGSGALSRMFCATLTNNSTYCWGENSFGMLGVGNTTNRLWAAATPIDFGTSRYAKKLSIGGGQVCAILDNNLVKCWGSGSNGALGYGDTTTRGDGASEMGDNLPYVDLGTGRTAKDIASGDLFNCAILDNNQVKCWGKNPYGALGQPHTNAIGDGPGEMGDALAYTDLGGKTAKKIAAGTYHACAILNDDSVKCWGNTYEGNSNYGVAGRQMGITSVNLSDYFIDLGSTLGVPNTATEIVMGGYTACALLNTGDYKCWGENTNGELGLGDTNHRGDDDLELGNYLPAINLGTGKTVKALPDRIAKHQCVILNDDNVKCWGISRVAATSISTISFSTAFNFGLEKSHIGTRSGDITSLGPINFGTSRYVKDFYYGDNAGCGLLDNDWFKCFGFNMNKKLGTTLFLGNTPNNSVDNLLFHPFSEDRKIIKMGISYNTSCYLFDDYKVACLGENGAGQMGVGDTTDKGASFLDWQANLKFVDFGFNRFAINLFVSRNHTCAILDNFELKCWGSGSDGRLGNESTNSMGNTTLTIGDNLPYVNLGSNRKIVDVALALNSSCAVLDNNSVKCWGDFTSNVLGISVPSDRGDGLGEMGDNLVAVNLGGATPLQIASNSEASHVCLIVNDSGNNRLRCWGENGSGQLGIGSTTDTILTTTNVDLGASTPIDVSLGNDHTCVLMANNDVKCFGRNAYGQLGIGSTNNIGDGSGEMGANLQSIGF